MRHTAFPRAVSRQRTFLQRVFPLRVASCWALLQSTSPQGASRRAAFLKPALAAGLGCAIALAGTAWAADSADPVRLTLKDHQFVPQEITVPAHQRFRIEVVNQDPTPAEFESSDLRVEKVVVPGGRITVMAGPLKPGTYKFFDDYHSSQTKGTLTAVAQPARE